jgi:hypothetical protein
MAQFLSKLLRLLDSLLGFYGKIIYVHSVFCFRAESLSTGKGQESYQGINTDRMTAKILKNQTIGQYLNSSVRWFGEEISATLNSLATRPSEKIKVAF